MHYSLFEHFIKLSQKLNFHSMDQITKIDPHFSTPPIQNKNFRKLKHTKSISNITISEKDQQQISKPQLEVKQSQRVGEYDSLISELKKDEVMNESGKNVLELKEFAQAWKSQSNFSVLLIQKLSLIVNNYFKMLGEMEQRNEELEVLIVYNKNLIEVLHKFEDQQRRLIHKLKTMQQFNVKIMKQLCVLKKRAFDPPQVRAEQSIFSRFSLKTLKYSPKKKQKPVEDQAYKKKIEQLFKIYLLEHNQFYIPLVEKKILEQEERLQQSRVRNMGNSILSNASIQISAKIQELRQLLDDIKSYNIGLNNVNCENMFDLYQMKWSIKTAMKNLDVEIKEDEDQDKEKQFVEHVKKIHANLSSLNEDQLQVFLKKEKEIRRKMKRQRVKEQEVFIRACEEVQNENVQLKDDIAKLKKRILDLQDELSRAKAQIQFKTMKDKDKRGGRTIMDQSILDSQSKSFRRSSRYDSKLDQQLKKQRQDNEKMKKQLQDLAYLLERNLEEKKQLEKKIQENNIPLQNVGMLSYDEIFKYLFDWFKNSKKNKEQEIHSPKLEDRSIVLQFSPISTVQFMKGSESQQKSLGSSEQKIKQKATDSLKRISGQVQMLRKRNMELEKRLTELGDSQDVKSRENLKKTMENQQKKYEEKQKQYIAKEINFISDINGKTLKIKELERLKGQYQENLKNISKRVTELEKLNQCAQRMSGKVIEEVEILVHEDFNQQKFLLLMDKMFANLQSIVQQYKKQTKRQIQSRSSFKMDDLTGGLYKKNTSPEKEKKSKLRRATSLNDNFDLKQTYNIEPKKFVDIGVGINEGQLKELQSSERRNKRQRQKQKQRQEDKILRVEGNSSRLPPPKLERSQKIFEKGDGSEKQQKVSSYLSIDTPSPKSKQKKRGIKNLSSIKERESSSWNQQFNENYSQQIMKEKGEDINSHPLMVFNMEKERKRQEMMKKKTAEADPKSEKEKLRQQLRKLPNKKKSDIKGEEDRQRSTKKRSTSKQSNQVSIQQRSCKQNEIKSSSAKSVLIFQSEKQPSKKINIFDKVKNEKLEGSISSRIQKQSMKVQKNIQSSGGIRSEDNIYKVVINSPKNQNLSSKSDLLSPHSTLQKNKISNKSENLDPGNEKFTQRMDEVVQKRHQIEKSVRNFSNVLEMNQVDLVLSQQQQIPIQFGAMERSAVNAGVEFHIVEQIYEKIKRLYNDDDALDFYQLFNRYKEALKSLQKAQYLNKLYEVRYQNFIKKIIMKQKNDPTYSIYQKLQYLTDKVRQQQQLLCYQKDEFQNSFMKYIVESQKNINDHIKLMRSEYFGKRSYEL